MAHTQEEVVAQTRMSHGTCMNESWHTHELVMAHTRMSHVTHGSRGLYLQFERLKGGVFDSTSR